MNFGAILRQAIVSGQFRRVVEVSRELMDARRRDRALADLNARGGIRGDGARRGYSGIGIEDDMLYDRGYRGAVVPPFRHEPWDLPVGERGLPFAYTASSPSGRVNYVNPATGARSTFAPDTGLERYGDPIVSPYEGVRVWPKAKYSDGIDYSTDGPGPWMGRGEAPWEDWYEGGYGDTYRQPSFWLDAEHGENVPRVFGGDAFSPMHAVNYYRPWSRPFMSWENVMATQPMDNFIRSRNIPF